MTDKSPPTDHRYFQVVLIYMKDPPKFARYLELMAPIVQRYGGALERALLPEAVYVEGASKPDTVNIVHYDSRDAFSAFNADPEFQAIAHLRSESIDMGAVGGFTIGGAGTSGDARERVYMVEFARFAASGAPGYRRYEDESDAVMRRYGYHVERVIAADSVGGLPFTPDVVKVAYFDTRDAMDRLRGDPAHARLEAELYPRAVAESMWLVAKVRPASVPQ
jgi:uncharacterized protein (DUF1330 family)